MNKIFSKKLLLLFSLGISISYGVLWACGWSDWDEYGVSAYAPEAFVDSAYKPFFYSDLFYYEIGHDNNHVERFNEQIVQEWCAYLGKPDKDKEVRFLLLSASAGCIDSILRFPAHALPVPVSGMQLIKEHSGKKVAAFLKFLAYAKANERYATTRYEYWNYDEKVPAEPLDDRQVSDRAAMEKEMKAAKDDFMAQRYFFQVVRSYFFAADYDACIAYYEQHKECFPDNTLAARTLSYVAGAFYKQKKYAEANYRYSKVYDKGAEFKTVAHFSFHPQNDTDWKQTLALCRNKQEQATLWHLLGIYFDEERAIREIYALDPRSEKLELLLARLVNIQEIRSNSESTEYGWGNYRPAKDSLDQGALRLVTDIADKGNTAKPYMWLVSAGYLHFINESYSKAASYYRRAQLVMPAGELADAQLRLFILMNNVAQTTKLDAERESFLLRDLVWLQSVADGKIPAFRCAHAYEWIKNTLAARYIKQKNDLRAELFVHRDTFYTNPVKVQQLKSFLLSRSGSDFDQYCRSVYQLSVTDITEFQYVALAYQDKIEAAINLFRQTDSATDGGVLPGNPFNGTIKDCHDCDHAAPQKIKYTKISFLQKMQEMKQLVAQGKDLMNNNLLLGNAFYNMTHYGNARYFYECAVIGSGHSAPLSLSGSFRAMLLRQDLAKQYYQAALAAATTEEQKAKISYLILKCNRNEWYNGLYQKSDYNSWEYADMPPTDFSPLLQFRQTRYYAEVLAECGYFRTYAGRHR